MINKDRTRAVKRRLAYGLYKAVFEAAKISPTETVRAACELVEATEGHCYSHVALAARDTCNFIIEEDECTMVTETSLKELPLLIEDLKYDSNKTFLELRLKEGK